MIVVRRRSGYILVLVTLLITAATGCAGQRDKSRTKETAAMSGDLEPNNILGSPVDTELTEPGRLTIRNVGEFEFKPRAIDSVRDDIFREGYFSIFDILLHLDARGGIDLAYHFDETMNTHVIDSLNGETHWWYRAYYHMGWGENNAFRMDHFPYKERMTDMMITPRSERLTGFCHAFSKSGREYHRKPSMKSAAAATAMVG